MKWLKRTSVFLFTSVLFDLAMQQSKFLNAVLLS
jgi:hypothetical protein